MPYRTSKHLRSTAVIATAGLLTSLVAVVGTAASASAAGTAEVRKADFIAGLGDTRSAGHFAYVEGGGLHVWTDDSSGQAKVAEYWAVSGSLASMAGSLPPVWEGSGTPASSQIVFDADNVTGNGNDYNILVGESVYNGDWWLSNGSSTTAKNASPRPPGGAGSDWHGTLAEWIDALPDATVYAGGFSLGSGVHSDGVIRSLALGATTYSFVHGLGTCDVSEDYPTKTVTLLADCETESGLTVQDGWTVDGDSHKITAVEDGSSFTGAVLQNEGTSMNVRDLTITTRGWDNPGANSGGNLAGIRFKNAAGSLENVVISGISHGNGVQEGNALDIDNIGGSTQRAVTVNDVTVTKYQKTGIRANGNVNLTLTDSTITAAGTPDSGSPIGDKTAANSVQVSRGAVATISGNAITGNDWDGSSDDDATAVLLYQAGAVTVEHNVITGAGTDIGIGAMNSTGAVKIRCNAVSRTDDPDADEHSNTGIWGEGNASSSVVDNTITGFGTATYGVTNVVNQGACLPATRPSLPPVSRRPLRTCHGTRPHWGTRRSPVGSSSGPMGSSTFPPGPRRTRWRACRPVVTTT